MLTFRFWRVLLLVGALVSPVPVAGIVHHHTAVIVQYDRATGEMQPEIASSTWTRHNAKSRGL